MIHRLSMQCVVNDISSDELWIIDNSNKLADKKNLRLKLSSDSPIHESVSSFQILPQLKEKRKSPAMIFISSYFDFVRLRNYFKREEIDFMQVTE